MQRLWNEMVHCKQMLVVTELVHIGMIIATNFGAEKYARSNRVINPFSYFDIKL